MPKPGHNFFWSPPLGPGPGPKYTQKMTKLSFAHFCMYSPAKNDTKVVINSQLIYDYDFADPQRSQNRSK